MTNKTKAAIEEAAKLPTAESLYETAFYDKSYDTDHGFINMKQRVVHIMESHTQAHTKELREQLKETENLLDGSTYNLKRVVTKYDKLCKRVKELEEIIVGINSCRMAGITWPNELKQKVEKIWEESE